MSIQQVRFSPHIWGSVNIDESLVVTGDVTADDVTASGSVAVTGAITGTSVVAGGSATGNPLNTQAGSAAADLAATGDIGLDGTLLYVRAGGTILAFTPSGTIAL